MGKKDILVVSAHAADYCTRAGGTLLRYVREGWHVHILCLSCGAHGESGDYWRNTPDGTYDGCCAIRREESKAAAKCLGAEDITFLDLPDYPIMLARDDGIQRDLTRRILDLRPEIVFTHWLNDPTNTDHQYTAELVVRALNSCSQIGAFPNTPAHYYPNVYFFESTVPMSERNGFDPDFYVDIDDVFEQKQRAIAQFKCQPFLGDFYVHFARHRAFQARVWSKNNIQYAEGFKRFVPYVGKSLPLSEHY